jgi:hypothetical protein
MHIFDSLPLASSAATQSRNRKRLQTERLERRQLLAADGLMALADTAIVPAEMAVAEVSAWGGSAGRSAEQASSFVGRLQQVEQDGEIRVASAQGEWEKFNTNDQTQVLDAAGNAVNLDELAGVKVRVTYHTEGTQQVADVVQVCRVQVAATAAGRLHGLAEGGPWGSRRDDLDRSAAGWVWAEGLSREADTLDRLFARGEIG